MERILILVPKAYDPYSFLFWLRGFFFFRACFVGFISCQFACISCNYFLFFFWGGWGGGDLMYMDLV